MKNIFEKSIVIVSALLIVVLAALIIIIPDKEISQKENRTLQQWPTFTFEKLKNGDLTEQIARYLTDQFPLRDGFVSLKAYCELALLKQENNGVVYGKGGVLIPRGEIENDRLEENLKAISKLSAAVEKEIVIAPLPRTVDVYKNSLPKAYHYENEARIWQKLFAGNKKALDLRDVLEVDGSYYKTDHHYTTKGAYITYCALGKELGFTPKSEDFFKIETVTTDFCGTAMRSSGFYLAKKDEIKLYRYENDIEYIVIADKNKISLYDFEKLNTVDKYAVFLGGNHARVDISNGKQGREKLLIIRDSFADSIAPFLALHYDITLIDLRYYTDSVKQLIETENIDKILVLQSITELATAKNISILQMP